MTTPHNATAYTNAAHSTPAETRASVVAEVTSAQDSYASSSDSAVEQYQLLTGRRPGPDPVITVLNPHETEIAETPQDFTVVITGENFYEDWSTVVWDGEAVETTFTSSTELEATVAGSDTVGSVEVYVANGDVSRSATSTFEFIEATP